MIAIARKGVTLLDLAMQYTGSADGVVEIARLNGLAIDTIFAGAQKVIVPDVKSREVEKIKQSGAEFCTGGGTQ